MAYIVCDAIALHSGDNSFPYVARGRKVATSSWKGRERVIEALAGYWPRSS